MRRWLGRSSVAVLVAATVVVALLTITVVRVVRAAGPHRDVGSELEVMRARLDGGAGEQAQTMFPEGYLFAWVLYGLAANNDARARGAGDGAPAPATADQQRAIAQATSPAGTAPFSPDLDPRFGVFHAGWTLLLRADTATLAPPDPATAGALAADADRLAAAFAANLDAGRSPFLAAYPSQSWPVDSVVAMAALRTVDRAIGTDHSALIDRWVARAHELVDPGTGLLPHVTDPVTGAMRQGTRGSSQTIIQTFWPTVDPAGAPAAYERFRQRFVASVAGAVGIREHPTGVDGPGDVDSGPLVFGLSASASTVAVAAARANGDLGLAAALAQEIEVLNPRWPGRHPLGLVPPADGFAAWARSVPAGPEVSRPGPVVWWPLWLAVPWAVVAGAWWLVARRRPRP